MTLGRLYQAQICQSKFITCEGRLLQEKFGIIPQRLKLKHVVASQVSQMSSQQLEICRAPKFQYFWSPRTGARHFVPEDYLSAVLLRSAAFVSYSMLTTMSAIEGLSNFVGGRPIASLWLAREGSLSNP